MLPKLSSFYTSGSVTLVFVPVLYFEVFVLVSQLDSSDGDVDVLALVFGVLFGMESIHL